MNEAASNGDDLLLQVANLRAKLKSSDEAIVKLYERVRSLERHVFGTSLESQERQAKEEDEEREARLTTPFRRGEAR